MMRWLKFHVFFARVASLESVAPTVVSKLDYRFIRGRLPDKNATWLCQKHGAPQSMCKMAALRFHQDQVRCLLGHLLLHRRRPNSWTRPRQSNGTGSLAYNLLSSFQAMSQLCSGAEFCNPTQTISHRRIRDGFVDDVTNFKNFGLTKMLRPQYGLIDLAQSL
jgi:hypothetical protein